MPAICAYPSGVLPRMLPVLFTSASTMALGLITSCSVNGFGPSAFVSSVRQETPGAAIVTIEAWGLHVYHTDRFGLQLGRIRHELLYPLLSDDHHYCLDWLKTATDSVSPTAAAAPVSYGRQPLRTDTHRHGLGLDFSPTSLRLTLGSTRLQRTRIPPQDNVMLIYDHRQQAPPIACLTRSPNTLPATQQGNSP